MSAVEEEQRSSQAAGTLDPGADAGLTSGSGTALGTATTTGTAATTSAPPSRREATTAATSQLPTSEDLRTPLLQQPEAAGSHQRPIAHGELPPQWWATLLHLLTAPGSDLAFRGVQGGWAHVAASLVALWGGLALFVGLLVLLRVAVVALMKTE